MEVSDIWARGGLGNQVIEYLYGIAEAIESGKTYQLLFSGKTPDKIYNVRHIEENPTVDQLFGFTQAIRVDRNKVRKTCYWDPHLTDLYFKHYDEIWARHVIPTERNRTSEEYVAIHVRGTDKMNERKHANKLYDDLFVLAKLNCLPVRIATDDCELAKYLCDRHGIAWEYTGNNAIQDWRLLEESVHIYSIYSTFAYSVLLVKPNIGYTVASYANSYELYEYVDNEFLVLCQLQKYCQNLSLLPSRNKCFKHDIGLDQCKMLSVRDIRDIASLSKMTGDVNRAINTICTNASKPDLPDWYIDGSAQQERLQNLISYFSSGDKNLYYSHIPVSIFEKGFYQSRQVLSHSIHKKNVESIRSNEKSYFTSGSVNEYCQVLDKEGVVIFPNFLGDSLFKRVRQELEVKENENIGSLSKNKSSLLSSKEFKESAVSKVFLSKEFAAFIAYLTGYPFETTQKMLCESTFFQKVIVSPGRSDVQTILHSDTFFPAFKFWYFPREVGQADSPFSYCKGTHLLTAERLVFDYKNALDAILDRSKGISIDHREGSFRATDNEIIQLSSRRSKICSPENTLVIANVFGYHARSFAEKSTSRISIHGSLRYTNPFQSY